MIKKIYNILFVLIFLGIIFYFPIMTKMTPNEATSFIENRTLKEMPKIELSSIFDGTFFPECEKYYSDHIAHRDNMILAYTHIHANVLKKPVVNDIVLTEKALLPLNWTKTSDKNLITRDAEKIVSNFVKLKNEIDSVGGRFIYVGVPNQSSIMRDEYPYYLDNNSEHLEVCEEVFFNMLSENSIEYINMMDHFKNEDYFKYYSITDHHYNVFGAYRTYEEIMKTLGLETEEFETVTLPQDFYGSRARIIYNCYHVKDKLSYMIPKKDVPFKRYDNGNQVNSILFPPTNENELITYGVFMGGDVAETYVYTDRPELQKLLIFGDSFTNPLETMLYLSFDTMLSVDLRHTTKSIYDYIDEYEPDVVIFVRDDINYLSQSGNNLF